MIHLNIPDMGAMQGRVRWVTDGKAGLRFALGTPDADEPRLGVGA